MARRSAHALILFQLSRTLSTHPVDSVPPPELYDYAGDPSDYAAAPSGYGYLAAVSSIVPVSDGYGPAVYEDPVDAVETVIDPVTRPTPVPESDTGDTVGELYDYLDDEAQDKVIDIYLEYALEKFRQLLPLPGDPSSTAVPEPTTATEAPLPTTDVVVPTYEPDEEWTVTPTDFVEPTIEPGVEEPFTPTDVAVPTTEPDVEETLAPTDDDYLQEEPTYEPPLVTGTAGPYFPTNASSWSMGGPTAVFVDPEAGLEVETDAGLEAVTFVPNGEADEEVSSSWFNWLHRRQEPAEDDDVVEEVVEEVVVVPEEAATDEIAPEAEAEVAVGSPGWITEFISNYFTFTQILQSLSDEERADLAAQVVDAVLAADPITEEEHAEYEGKAGTVHRRSSLLEQDPSDSRLEDASVKPASSWNKIFSKLTPAKSRKLRQFLSLYKSHGGNQPRPGSIDAYVNYMDGWQEELADFDEQTQGAIVDLLASGAPLPEDIPVDKAIVSSIASEASPAPTADVVSPPNPIPAADPIPGLDSPYFALSKDRVEKLYQLLNFYSSLDNETRDALLAILAPRGQPKRFARRQEEDPPITADGGEETPAELASETPAEEPLVGEPAEEIPVGPTPEAPAEEPLIGEPAPETPAGPSAETPIEESAPGEPAPEILVDPAAEDPVADEPTAEELTTEEPTVEAPLIGEPTVEKPITEEPIVEPTLEEPTTEQYAGPPYDYTQPPPWSVEWPWWAQVVARHNPEWAWVKGRDWKWPDFTGYDVGLVYDGLREKVWGAAGKGAEVEGKEVGGKEEGRVKRCAGGGSVRVMCAEE